jgi:hypothetical protein
MLLRLLSGAEETDFVLVLATVGLPLDDLLLSLLAGRAASLLTLDPSGVASRRWETAGGATSLAAIQLEDVLGWEGEPARLDRVPELLEPGRRHVLLDGLTELLVLTPEPGVARLVAGLRAAGRLVAALHTDCLPEEVVAAVEHQATTVLTVEEASGREQLVTIRHRKPGGRAVRSQELVTVGPDGRLAARPFTEQKAPVEEEEDVEAAVKGLTTFSLSTSREAEQAAREKLVLPFYTEEQRRGGGEGEVRIQGEAERKGAIYYEPDSGDDWDDDDPDDDLDF